MDAIRVGRSLRALRVRRGLRQIDVARMASCSRAQISKVEQGGIVGTSIGGLAAVAGALGADLEIRVRWHGEGLDRLLDEAHSDLVDAAIRRLRALSWECEVEVTFSEWGERGSIDIIGWHAASAAMLVCEVKSLLPDVQATLGALDRKARLAPKLAGQRGHEAASFGRLLLIADSSTTRRRVATHTDIFRVAYPQRGAAAWGWLRRPGGDFRGLIFLPDATAGSVRRPVAGRQRVNRSPGRQNSPK